MKIQQFDTVQEDYTTPVDDLSTTGNDPNTDIEEDAEQVPESGDMVRTKRTEMEGRVERLSDHEVFFRIADGRLMKTPLSNVIVVQKLEDGGMGGINRSAPSNDVSYEKVLDDIVEEWNKLNTPDLKKPKLPMPKAKVKEKQPTQPLPESFEDRLTYFLNSLPS